MFTNTYPQVAYLYDGRGNPCAGQKSGKLPFVFAASPIKLIVVESLGRALATGSGCKKMRILARPSRSLTWKPGQGSLGRRTATWPSRLSSCGIPSCRRSSEISASRSQPALNVFSRTRSISLKLAPREREPLLHLPPIQLSRRTIVVFQINPFAFGAEKGSRKITPRSNTLRNIIMRLIYRF